MTFFAPELAERKFQNRRPVRRSAILMWVLGALVLAFNIWLYSTHFSTLSDFHERQEVLKGEIATEREAIDDLEERLAGVNLEWQNRQVVLLNGLIDQRTFSWSVLIDHLAEVLPPKVRINRLTPRLAVDRNSDRGRASAERDEQRVVLSISGSADDGEALLQFIDGLFTNPRFKGPVLAGESRGDSGEISSFSLSVDYLPDLTSEAPPGDGEEAAVSQKAAVAAEGDDETEPPGVEEEVGP